MAALVFGALAPPLHEQLGVKAPEVGSTAWHWERDAVELARLHVRGIITDAEVHKARRRIIRRINSEVTAAHPPPSEG